MNNFHRATLLIIFSLFLSCSVSSDPIVIHDHIVDTGEISFSFGDNFKHLQKQFIYSTEPIPGGHIIDIENQNILLFIQSDGTIQSIKVYLHNRSLDGIYTEAEFRVLEIEDLVFSNQQNIEAFKIFCNENSLEFELEDKINRYIISTQYDGYAIYATFMKEINSLLSSMEISPYVE